MNIFEQARRCISRSVIESLFFTPGAYWQDAEYWTLSPLRADNTIGSFHIREDGQYYDHATDDGGDLIALLSKTRNIDKGKAARVIIETSGGTVDEEKSRESGKTKKPPPVIPVPPEALPKLNPVTKSAWSRDHHGTPSSGWKYYTAEGKVAFCVVRYDKPNGDKDVIPYYWGKDGKWHEGQAYTHDRPLYRLHELLKSDLPVLVVEGEKCSEIPVDGYILTTWPGGGKAITKSDWSPLEKRNVTIWPDADEPGIKAAAAIKNRLPDARILDIQGKPKAWDIADAATEKIDIPAFIRDCPIIDLVDNTPFAYLGFSDTHHWFLRKGMRIPMSISMGSFNQSKLLELAPLNFWTMLSMTTDTGGIRIAQAQDMICRASEDAGRYLPDSLRGAGVWREPDGSIIVNDGEQIILSDGSSIPYAQFKSPYHYVSSEVRFGDLAGDCATAEEGRQLAELFDAQGYSSGAMSVCLMGWSLIAPFGGLLDWRPHIWLTGQKGVGKSWTIHEVIHPLCGAFSYLGSGRDSEPGIRRSLRTDARPVILDEMMPVSRKAQTKLENILELARNASSNTSGYIHLANPDGGVDRFRVRSCFLFASVNVPTHDAQVDSRIIRCELAVPADKRARFDRIKQLKGVLFDPQRFTRRIFRALPRIIQDIADLREKYLRELGDPRQVDQYAPLLAAAWAAQSDESIGCEQGQEWIDRIFENLIALNEEKIEDEDRIIEHILGYGVRTDKQQMRTITELLQIATGYDPDKIAAEELLSRMGIKLTFYRNGDRNDHPAVAFALHADPIQKMLIGTPYEHGYDAQLRRHPMCINAVENRQLRFALGKLYCRMLDWESFKKKYIETEEGSCEKS